MNWEAFELAPAGERSDPPRALTTPEGVGDRLRAAAFAEIQARDAFRWAAEHFTEAAPELKDAWLRLAKAEQRHLDWLLTRLTELGLNLRDRKVSDHLWRSLMACTSAQEFARFMANAEERGRKAGERFHEALRHSDVKTAEIFREIAREEVEHIALAARFFPS